MACVAVVQMVSTDNVNENLQELEQFFINARENEAELIALPENFAFMGRKETDKLAIAEEYGQGTIQQLISDLAKRYGLWVIAGTMPLRASAQRVKASCLVYDDHGDCVAQYNKIHLFDARISASESHQESLTIERGKDVVVVDTPIGRVGLSVCYDLRFPELFQQLMIKGAEILSVPSAFTAVTGLAHWDILLRARAIENLCYVLAPNQGGSHVNGRNTHGHSMIVEPWGNVLSEHQQGSGIVFADIDLLRLRALRRDFPCNDHHILHQLSL